ncbi:MAG TPA: hypothetical protein VE783_06105 [Candidatus Limnocylindrales bacterium]|nr:hypothetical protein [Candidatus Limnocylindrales bacterium]
MEKKVPGAFTPVRRSPFELLPTGVEKLDREIGGLPLGGLSQLCAPSDMTTGRTTVMVSTMAQLTRKGRFCALVDANDAFDPIGAQEMGVDLRRVLWFRGRRTPELTVLEQAFKAADILVNNGGFELIFVDIADVPEEEVRRVPMTTWFRFARVVEKHEMGLVFLLPYAAAQSCAALTVQMKQAKILWQGPEFPAHALLFAGLEMDFEVERGRRDIG